jgi:PilZ domain
MNSKDKRISKRRPMHYTAVLALGPSEFQRCRLSDVSTTGARIEVEDADKLPEQFILFLSKNGSARRACRVVWRNPGQVGVKFQIRLGLGDRATLVPDADADAAPAVDEPGESVKAD